VVINPLAMTAGITTLRIIAEDPDFYHNLNLKIEMLTDGIRAQAEKAGFTLQYHHVGGMFGLFFSDQPVYDYDSAKLSDLTAFSVFFHSMLEQGVYLAPSQFEAGFMSAAHSEADIQQTIAASAKAFAKLAELRC
jgi:glutamate-1-semialdehyde 2,1-aminomutase